jgi:hypothetical protein
MGGESTALDDPASSLVSSPAKLSQKSEAGMKEESTHCAGGAPWAGSPRGWWPSRSPHPDPAKRIIRNRRKP